MALISYKDIVADEHVMPSWSDNEFQAVINRTPDYLRMCYRIAETSHDPDTRIGAILVAKNGVVVGSGSNRLTFGATTEIEPEKVRLEAKCQRPQKYDNIEHAERNAIFDVIRNAEHVSKQNGGSFEYIMFCPYFACLDCSKAIVQSGIKWVIGHKQAMDLTPARWRDSIDKGRALFDQGGVDYCEYDGLLDVSAVMNGLPIRL